MAERGSAAGISRQYLERSTYHRLKLKTVMSPPPLRLPNSPTIRFPPKPLAFTSAAMSTISTSSTPSSPPLTDLERSSLSQVLTYHNQTKHSFTNYARGPRGLDWANQPNPFRRFVSSPLLPLLRFPTRDENPTQPSSSESLFDGPLYGSLFRSLPPPEPVSYSSISRFFYDSLALSAWKTAGNSTWSLRVNPSSGNLHPTEAYVVLPEVGNLYGSSSFVAHYAPKEHALEVRAEIPSGFLRKFFPEDCFLVGLSSIFWREAWKYGERAFRYCNHDVGHAIAAVSMAAAGLGWDVRILDGLGYEDLKKLMGLHVYKELPIPSRPVKGKIPDIEFEHPDCVLAVFPSGSSELRVDYGEVSAAIADFPKLEWKGRPNMLSKQHVCWDVIYRTAEAVEKPLVKTEKFSIDPFVSSGSLSEKSYKGFTVREVVRKRRSAVDMDGVTTMDRDTFYQILLHCLPSGYVIEGKQMKPTALPFRALSWDAQVHATLFVHRVTGLPKGLYFLVRNEGHFEKLRKSTRPDFDWVKPEGCPVNLPLYELATANCEKIAKQLSCHQDIAGDGCFSLGMIAHLEPTLHEKGPWMYPRLFWETGVLGQVLYLEAHAVGISATGIGCFFDDPVHELLGLKGLDFQSLYHFTVGGPVLDRRIMSLPAYPGPNIDA